MIDINELYPLKFASVYVRRMWGGTMLRDDLKREIDYSDGAIGEAWEIADRQDAQSIVVNGELTGKTLNELLRHYGSALIGRNYSGGRFPLLVKIIDAGKRLSLQVHPDLDASRRIGNGAEPKTEMWYVIGGKAGASIIAGIAPTATKRQLVDNFSSLEVEKYLQVYPAIPGDGYFIGAGTIHAIGAGCLLLEIQQNSDTTYRVSDWGRVDEQGKSRELHVEQALKSINFTDRSSPRISGASNQAGHNRKYPVVQNCPFFKVDDLRLVDEWPDNTDNASFHLLCALDPVTVGRDDKAVELARGESCLIPSAFGRYRIVPQSKTATVVKTSI